jgi:hypothetical protein
LETLVLKETNMTNQKEIVQQAIALPKEARKRVLLSFKERELYPHLKNLLTRMDSGSLVEITHGSDEYGKDLVMVREDQFGRTVIAIVVKTGDIRAKTLGKIDEVKSQVNQAIAHPAVLKVISGSLPVSTVWVILAGELSNQAQKRLEQEVDTRNLQIFDLNWLIESFTQYYPQVFFEGQVMDLLQEKIQELEIRHMFCDRGKTLSECFVEPVVAVIDIPLTFDEEKLILAVREKKMPFSRLGSLTRAHRRLMLAGDPGTGKSVALAKLGIDMLRKASDSVIRKSGTKEIEIPILTSAMKMLDHSSCEEFVQRHIPYTEIRDRFRIVTILVDGLDEAPPDRREHVLEKAVDFSNQLGSSLIITSRKIDLIKSTPPGFNKYEILPFEFGQALALFDKLISDLHVLEVLKDGLDKIQFQVSLTPLSLNLLIELAESHRELPASVTELYERFCDLVLGRYDREKGIEVLFEYLVKKRFLSALSYDEFYKKDRLVIPEQDFAEFLSRYARLYGWDQESLQGFVCEVERAGVLDLQDAVVFRHRSFLDYFVAQYIYDNREVIENLEDKIVEIYFDDVWGDVAFFYIGLRRDIRHSTLEKIFAKKDGDLTTRIDKLLAGRLLQAAWHTTQEAKLQGIDSAVAYALPTRESFLELARRAESAIPGIYADFFVMAIADYSFGSGFLLEEVDLLFKRIQDQPSAEGLYRMLTLLWSVQRLLEPEGIREKTRAVLETMSKVPDLDLRDESIALLLLDLMEKKDKAIAKTIRKRLRILGKKYPRLLGDILPPGPRGARQRKK